MPTPPSRCEGPLHQPRMRNLLAKWSHGLLIHRFGCWVETFLTRPRASTTAAEYRDWRLPDRFQGTCTLCHPRFSSSRRFRTRECLFRRVCFRRRRGFVLQTFPLDEFLQEDLPVHRCPIILLQSLLAHFRAEPGSTKNCQAPSIERSVQSWAVFGLGAAPSDS